MVWVFTIEDYLKNKNKIYEFCVDDNEKLEINLKKVAKMLNKEEFKINKIGVKIISKENILETMAYGKLSESEKCFDSYFDFTRYDLVFSKR